MSVLDWTAAWSVVLIWALNFVVAKTGVGEMPPLFFLALRFSLVALLLIPWLRPLGSRFRQMLLLSVVLGCCHFGLLFVGLSGVDAGPAAIAIQLGVPFSTLFARLVYGERIGPWQMAGMGLAFSGIWLLAGTPAEPPSLSHLTLVVIAAAAWAGANILIKRLGDIRPFVLSAWLGLLAAPQLLVMSLLLEQGQIAALVSADWRGYGAVFYTAVASSIAAYGLWYYLIGKHAVNQVVPITFLAPVLAVGLAALLLDEPLTWATVGGGLVTLGGVAMIQFLRPASSPVARRPAP